MKLMVDDYDIDFCKVGTELAENGTEKAELNAENSDENTEKF